MRICRDTHDLTHPGRRAFEDALRDALIRCGMGSGGTAVEGIVILALEAGDEYAAAMVERYARAPQWGDGATS